MNNDPSLLRKLEQKETQERQLTEEWTEKWKEAAKILKEQSALALKQVAVETADTDNTNFAKPIPIPPTGPKSIQIPIPIL